MALDIAKAKQALAILQAEKQAQQHRLQFAKESRRRLEKHADYQVKQ